MVTQPDKDARLGAQANPVCQYLPKEQWQVGSLVFHLLERGVAPCPLEDQALSLEMSMGSGSATDNLELMEDTISS